MKHRGTNPGRGASDAWIASNVRMTKALFARRVTRAPFESGLFSPSETKIGLGISSEVVFERSP